MSIGLIHYSFRVIRAYRNDYLFSQKTLSSYMKLWLVLLACVVHDFLNFGNFVSREFQKFVFDFYNFIDIIFKCLSI